MIGKEECMDIWALAKQGYSQRAIAKKLGLNRRTVAKYLSLGELPRYKTVSRRSGLEPYHGMIKDWLSQEDYQATKIHDLLVLQSYEGSYETVKRFVRKVKGDRDRIAYVRFETVPGYQAQVDFADFKIVEPDGSQRTVYGFIMVLGFSRHMYVEFVDHCTMPVFLDCHKRAFGFFGGVPAEILYDNMKTVVIRRLVGRVEFNDTFTDFAAHYRFKPVACPPYSPWYKGKVERPVHYLRERFWRGYSFTGLKRANRDVRDWVSTVANSRIHGTTRQRVSERFAQERNHLGDIPARPYDTSCKVTRKVYRDCRVSFGANHYVVPHKYVGKKVLLKIKAGIMRVFHDDIQLVAYRIPQGKGQLIAYPRFYAALKADKEQLERKYRVPAKKGKATRGLVKDGLRFEMVATRDIREYERLVEVDRV
jgi:transposase